MIFTSNSDRSVGYILQADKPIGEKASKVCVYNRIADIRFSDARKSGVPQSVLLEASNSDALKKCSDLVKDKKISPGSCLPLNELIQKGEPLGQRVMFQAFNVKKQSDGLNKADGTLTTVTGNVNESVDDDPKNPGSRILGDVLYSSLPDGATIVSAILVYPKYTEYGLLSLE